MKVELPKFKRCCFCIPLRYGLIMWGYLKLITTVLLLIFIVTAVDFGNYMRAIEMAIAILTILALITDIVFNIVFVTAAHLKNVKLFRIYYYYSIAEFILLSLLMIYDIGRSIYTITVYWETVPLLYILMMTGLICVNILNILLQFYFIRLIKCEIRKLKDQATIKLVSVKVGNETTPCTFDQSNKEKEEKVTYDRLISNEE